MLAFFKHIFLWCLVSVLSIAFVSAAGTDLLSKIVITSTNATCIKDPVSQGSFIFTYQNNVHVTFADQSTVTADSLEIIIDGKQKDKNCLETLTASKQSSLSHFKQIMFKDNVCLTNAHRRAVAQTARFYLQDQLCILEGGVKIWQAKCNPKDVPITIDSQKAELHLATSHLKLLGTAQQPVSTTILLEGHPALQKKEKPAKKKTKQSSHDKSSKNSDPTVS